MRAWPTSSSTACCAAAGDRSVLVITHRDAEAARCDATVTLEAGRVVPAQSLSDHPRSRTQRGNVVLRVTSPAPRQPE